MFDVLIGGLQFKPSTSYSAADDDRFKIWHADEGGYQIVYYEDGWGNDVMCWYWSGDKGWSLGSRVHPEGAVAQAVADAWNALPAFKKKQGIR